jgi:hypothetical protein
MRPLQSNRSHEYVYYICQQRRHGTHLCISAETNRKCPRWAEFNSPNAPPPLTPSAVASGSGTVIASAPSYSGGGLFGSPPADAMSPSAHGATRPLYAPSPLATSPPMSMDVDEGGSSAPKLKLNIGKRG